MNGFLFVFFPQQLYSIPSSPLSPVDNGAIMMTSLAHVVSRPTRSMSTSSGGSHSSEPSTPSSLYPKAPGSERSERSGSREDEQQVVRQKDLLFVFLGEVHYFNSLSLYN